MTTSMQDYRAVFISDTHLGFKGSKARQLSNFLDSHHSEHLYLVGDVVDGWRMNRRIHWPEEHTKVVHQLLAKSNNGTEVHYIVGNHDEVFRSWLDWELSFGRIKFCNQRDHYGADGKRYLVIHGDLFDDLMYSSVGRTLMFAGSYGYDVLLQLNSASDWLLGKCKLPPISLTNFAKRQTKAAVSYVLKFESLLAEHAREHDYDGVICGHIHTPVMRSIDDIAYLNCGDWVDNCSAIVEHHDGRWELLRWSRTDG